MNSPLAYTQYRPIATTIYYTHQNTQDIPYSQFLRVRRICTNIIDFRQHSLTLASHFIRRDYLVSAALTRAELQDRSTLLNKHNIPNSFYLVVTHNPKTLPLRDIVYENRPLLSKSKTTRGLENANLIFGVTRIYQTI